VDIVDRLKNHTTGNIDELMSDAIAEIEYLRSQRKPASPYAINSWWGFIGFVSTAIVVFAVLQSVVDFFHQR
jgi:hypothetical protein